MKDTLSTPIRFDTKNGTDTKKQNKAQKKSNHIHPQNV